MPKTPKVKFQPDPNSWLRAYKQAEFHSFGPNGDSVNDLTRFLFTQWSLVKPEQLMQAVAALKPYQTTNPFRVSAAGPRRTVAAHSHTPKD